MTVESVPEPAVSGSSAARGSGHNSGSGVDSRARWGRGRDRFTAWALVLAWLVVVALFAVLDGGSFFSSSDFESIFTTQSVLLVLALSLVVPFSVGEFDLSIAGTMGIVYVLIGSLTINDHVNVLFALLIALAVALVVGAINAFLVVRLGLESIVVTLGTGTLLYGLGYAVITGPIVGVPSSLVNVVDYKIGPLSVQFYLAVILVLAAWYVLGWTPLGRYLYVVGSSREVARLSGIPVNRIRAASFLVAALIAGLAGVLLSGSTGGADPSTASGYLLAAFAAVFLGATAVTPGRFNAPGTFVAVYFLTTGVTGLELRGLTGWVEQVFYGGALVAGVAISRVIGVVAKVSRS